jgi:hypothetical protein
VIELFLKKKKKKKKKIKRSYIRECTYSSRPSSLVIAGLCHQ